MAAQFTYATIHRGEGYIAPLKATDRYFLSGTVEVADGQARRFVVAVNRSRRAVERRVLCGADGGFVIPLMRRAEDYYTVLALDPIGVGSGGFNAAVQDKVRPAEEGV